MDLKKILAAATALACLTAPALAVDAGATGGLSISPHADGVCAPNTPIVQEDGPAAVEPAEEPEGAEPDESEAADLTAWEDDEDGLTIEEKVARNRDPDCPIWYDILPWDCPGHEWSEVEPNYEDDGTTLRIWNSRSCLNCGYTEIVGEVVSTPLENGPECAEPAYNEDTCPGHEWDGPFLDVDEEGNESYTHDCLKCGKVETVENGPECVEPEDTGAEEYHNNPVTDEEIQAALETFDPTIDDPQYQREYERYQRDHGNQEEAEDVGSPVLYEETDDETC